MYDHILVPTDGSDHAIRAAEHGAMLAGAFDATVHLLSVVDIDAEAGPFSAGGIDDDHRERLLDEGRSTAESTAAAAGLENVQTAVRAGHPAAEILAYVEETAVDLVAMGTRGRTGLRRYLTGSVAERVLRRSPVPVLATPVADEAQLSDHQEVLVPTDGSERADAATAHALAIAERFDSRVHAVGVVNVGDIATGSEFSLPAELVEELEAAAQAAVDSVAEAAREAGLDAVTAVRVGRPNSSRICPSTISTWSVWGPTGGRVWTGRCSGARRRRLSGGQKCRC